MHSLYLEGNPFHETQQRVIRTEGHSTIIDIIGPWLPRETDAGTLDLHYASMLVLCKLWHEAVDLKPTGESWKDTFNSFKSITPGLEWIASNVQYCYECKDSADKEHAAATADLANNGQFNHDILDDSDAEGSTDEPSHGCEGLVGSEEDLSCFILEQERTDEMIHGRCAIKIAKAA